MCLMQSILFEFIEYSLEHQMANFQVSECVCELYKVCRTWAGMLVGSLDTGRDGVQQCRYSHGSPDTSILEHEGVQLASRVEHSNT